LAKILIIAGPIKLGQVLYNSSASSGVVNRGMAFSTSSSHFFPTASLIETGQVLYNFLAFFGADRFEIDFSLANINLTLGRDFFKSLAI